jgi:hypothetical protein
MVRFLVVIFFALNLCALNESRDEFSALETSYRVIFGDDQAREKLKQHQKTPHLAQSEVAQALQDISNGQRNQYGTLNNLMEHAMVIIVNWAPHARYTTRQPENN